VAIYGILRGSMKKKEWPRVVQAGEGEVKRVPLQKRLQSAIESGDRLG
jgi:hypothetical protein